MRNEELKLPEHNYDELSIKSRFTALTANDQPPVGASIARPRLPCLKGAVKRKLDCGIP